MKIIKKWFSKSVANILGRVMYPRPCDANILSYFDSKRKLLYENNPNYWSQS